MCRLEQEESSIARKRNRRSISGTKKQDILFKRGHHIDASNRDHLQTGQRIGPLRRHPSQQRRNHEQGQNAHGAERKRNNKHIQRKCDLPILAM